MKRSILVIAALLTMGPPLEADILAKYDFGTVSMPTRNSSDTDPNTTASTFTDGAGLTGVFDITTGNPAPALSVAAALTSNSEASAVSGNAYYTFTITPTAGFKFSLTSLTFDRAIISPTGSITGSFFVRSSADAFATDIGIVNTTSTSTFTGTTISLSGSPYQNLTAALAFRLYIFDNNNAGSRFDLVDNVTLNGTAALVPEPSTWAIFTARAGLLLGLQRFRRKKS